ncbi:MAG: CPBP family intramembrane glutamic endopeptidase [Chloroflexota bacterium]
MQPASAPPAPGAARRVVVGAAWAIVLATSLLPTVVLQELFGVAVPLGPRTVIALAVLAVAALLTLPAAPLRALRPLIVVIAALVGGRWIAFGLIASLPAVHSLTADGRFAVSMPAEVVLNGLVTLVMVAVLMALTRDRHAFYLARGDLSAPAQPVAWMGIGPGATWMRVGPVLAVAISGGTLAFLVLSGSPSGGMLGVVIATLPAILFAAAMNAINEEVGYKASILSSLEGPLDRRDALRMTAAYFGIAHFYGVPYGIIGVALAWFLGWVLARSMLETRGIAWAWFIHFLQDVLIFAFMAAVAIVPGGA